MAPTDGTIDDRPEGGARYGARSSREEHGPGEFAKSVAECNLQGSDARSGVSNREVDT